MRSSKGKVDWYKNPKNIDIKIPKILTLKQVVAIEEKLEHNRKYSKKGVCVKKEWTYLYDAIKTVFVTAKILNIITLYDTLIIRKSYVITDAHFIIGWNLVSIDCAQIIFLEGK